MPPPIVDHGWAEFFPSTHQYIATSAPIVVNQQREEVSEADWRRFESIVTNDLESREGLFNRFFGGPWRTNVDHECGYPANWELTPQQYQDLYDHEPLATRVVQLFPKESWKGQPEVTDDPDPSAESTFKRAVADLGKTLRGDQSWYQGDKGNPLWEVCERADTLSGIGHFGIVLIGINDGLNLDQPADGVMTLDPVANEQPRLAETEVWKDFGGDEDRLIDETLIANARAKAATATAAMTVTPAIANVPALARGPSGVPIEAQGTGGGWGDGRGQTYEFQQVTGTSFAGAQGTDQQYVGVQLSPSQYPATKPSAKKRKLTFLRVYGENLVQITQYEANIRNPRFGLPVMYRVTLNDPRQAASGIGLPLATVRVHWSRCLHVMPENQNSSEVFSTPRMRPVLAPILDAHKVRGGSAVMFWRAAFPGYSLETNPQLGGDVIVNTPALRKMMASYWQGLDRAIFLRGMTAKSLAPQCTDPTPWLAAYTKAICVQLGCPVPVFEGYEIGEQASANNSEDWDDRCKHRQDVHNIPKVIVPLLDRFIALGILPQPKGDGYTVKFPGIDNLSQKDKAAVALQKTQALQAYVAGGIEAVFPFDLYLTKIMGMDPFEAQEVNDEAMAAQQSEDQLTMPPAGEPGHPTTPGPDPMEMEKLKQQGGQDEEGADQGDKPDGEPVGNEWYAAWYVSNDQTRYPAGSPKGGQFAPGKGARTTTAAESDAKLKWQDGAARFGKNEANPALPHESRPALSDHQRGALQKYSMNVFRPLNQMLRGETAVHHETGEVHYTTETGKSAPTHNPAGYYERVHEHMQAAFAATPVMKKPVTVVRGMRLSPEQTAQFHQHLQAAQATGGHVTIGGYTSTARPDAFTRIKAGLGVGSAVPSAFRGNVHVKIRAVHGIDMSPHSQLPGEGELLLNHDSKFKVHRVVRKGTDLHVELHQLPPDKHGPTANEGRTGKPVPAGASKWFDTSCAHWKFTAPTANEVVDLVPAPFWPQPDLTPWASTFPPDERSGLLANALGWLGTKLGLGSHDLTPDPTPSGRVYKRDQKGRFAHVAAAAVKGGLEHVKALGGSNGAYLAKDKEGTHYVVKQPPGKAAQLANEVDADHAYKALGLAVPHTALVDGKVKLAKFIEGAQTLGEWEKTATHDQKQAMYKQIGKGFVADALMANWDVVGLSRDNILVTKGGVAVRADNGGALKYRAQGGVKYGFGTVVGELVSMKNHGTNPSAAKVFAHVTDQDIHDQIKDVLTKKAAVLAAIHDPETRAVMEGRFNDLASKLPHYKAKAEALAKIEAAKTPQAAAAPLTTTPTKPPAPEPPKPSPVQHAPAGQPPTHPAAHLHTGEALADYIKQHAGETWFSQLHLDKIKYVNPDGLKGGSIITPVTKTKANDNLQLERLKKILPPGTVIHQSDIKGHQMAAGHTLQSLGKKKKVVGHATGETMHEGDVLFTVNPTPKPKPAPSVTKPLTVEDHVGAHAPGQEIGTSHEIAAKTGLPIGTTISKIHDLMGKGLVELKEKTPGTFAYVKAGPKAPETHHDEPTPESPGLHTVTPNQWKSLLGTGTNSHPAHLVEHQKAAWEHMTATERAAVVSYTGGSYAALNSSMRQCPPEFKCVQNKLMAPIMKALDKTPPLPSPTRVVRGIRLMSDSAVEKLVNPVLQAQASGQSISLPSFTSTTLMTSPTFGSSGSKGVVFHITARTGLYVGDVSHHSHEMELVQSPKAKYKVVGVYRNGPKGQTMVKLEEVL